MSGGDIELAYKRFSGARDLIRDGPIQPADVVLVFPVDGVLGCCITRAPDMDDPEASRRFVECNMLGAGLAVRTRLSTDRKFYWLCVSAEQERLDRHNEFLRMKQQLVQTLHLDPENEELIIRKMDAREFDSALEQRKSIPKPFSDQRRQELILDIMRGDPHTYPGFNAGYDRGALLLLSPTKKPSKGIGPLINAQWFCVDDFERIG
eukprot:TRINITY_DN5124_c0_g1_i1.p1 TRINITY_DN5124_c0_g1~~TRINITY_DN5124_c0_g1_i1.p1  ORF type:complete len:207 (+),score=10.23 TRINITY_DN5124_c0_g1_i1:60-680(+)